MSIWSCWNLSDRFLWEKTLFYQTVVVTLEHAISVFLWNSVRISFNSCVMVIWVTCRTVSYNPFLMPYILNKLNSQLLSNVIKQLSQSEKLCDYTFLSFWYGRRSNTLQVFTDLWKYHWIHRQWEKHWALLMTRLWNVFVHLAYKISVSAFVRKLLLSFKIKQRIILECGFICPVGLDPIARIFCNDSKPSMWV